MLLNNLIAHPNTLLLYWWYYCVICIPLVYYITWSLPFKLRYKKLPPFILFYLLAILVIFFGIFIVFAIYLVLTYMAPKTKVKIPFSTASFPEYQRSPQSDIALYGEGAGFKMVTEDRGNKSSRKEMLVMMNQFQTPQMNQINVLVLDDTADEMRLYAQSLMEKQEERLMHLTTTFTNALLKTEDIYDAAVYKKVLAHVLWEQIYKQLTTHLNLEVTYEKIKNLAKDAFHVLLDDSELPLLLAKIAMRQLDYDQAKIWLDIAQHNDAPDFKTMPYFAELAFRNKKYSDIGLLFQNKMIVNLEPLISYWTNHD